MLQVIRRQIYTKAIIVVIYTQLVMISFVQWDAVIKNPQVFYLLNFRLGSVLVVRETTTIKDV